MCGFLYFGKHAAYFVVPQARAFSSLNGHTLRLGIKESSIVLLPKAIIIGTQIFKRL